MIQPKTVSIPCQDGTEKEFIVAKFPALAGREIVTQYVTTALQKADGYKANEELMLKAMGFVAVPVDSGEIRLTTRALVDNHVPDFECLMRLEAALLDYNTNFMQRVKSFASSSDIGGTAMSWVSRTLIPLLAQSSVAEKPPSKNSGKITPSKKLTT